MLEKLISIAREAGEIILRVREKGLDVGTKGDAFDFVTTADIESEKYIIAQLQKEFPDHTILSEERGIVSGTNTQRVWLVDPLDGTKDFKNGGTGFSVMIGLCEKDVPTVGVVYAPAKKRTYYAQKGKGAFQRVDGKDIPLHVRSTSEISEAIMVTRIPGGEKRDEDKLDDFFEVKAKIPDSSVGVKVGLIVEGKADFHINTNYRATAWDTCAPQVILEEAGGKMTDLRGNPLRYTQKGNRWENSFVATNKILHDKVIQKINQFYKRTGKFAITGRSLTCNHAYKNGVH